MSDATVNFRPQLVGARVQRVEDPRLLTGAGSFVADRKLPRMLHVAFRRSDYAHARITGIDIAAAAAMPGVTAVFTGADLSEMTNVVRASSRMPGYYATPLRPLALDKVRYVGEPVVAVVAEDRYAAEDALEHVVIDVEPLDALVDPEAAVADGAALLHEEAGSNMLGERTFARGEVEAAFDEAAVRIQGRFCFHRKTPTAIEARSYVADYDKGARALTLYSTTQVPGIIRDALVEILDMPANRLRVIAPDVGGGFGAKTSLYPEEMAVCAIARHLARPIKWVSDRIEDLTATNQSFDEIVEAELALDNDGGILGLRADVTGDVGAYSIYPWTAVIEPVQVVSFLPGPYRMPSYRATVRAVATSKTPMGPYRGVGRPAAAFVMERLIDKAARRLSIDPAEMRRRNLVAEDEFPYKTGSGIVWDQTAFTECLERVCATVDYESLRAEQAAARAEGRWVGIGFASYAELTGIGSRIAVAPGMPLNTGTETATIEIDTSGAVTARFAAASFGQGVETSLAQVVADALGARLEEVDIVYGDSAAVTHGTGSYASRSGVLSGGAAILASQALVEKIKRVGAHLLEAAEEDIETRDGTVFVAGTDRSMSFRELARAVYAEMGRVPKEIRDEIGNLDATKVYDPFFGTTSAATHLAVVEIDPETYAVTVKKYLVAEDCGRIINPAIADGQAHGGVAQGIGVALLEEVVHDETGQILTASLVDYVVPAATEIPPIEVTHVESVSPSTVGGFRGLGEGGTIGAPAAVANAVTDALAPLGIEVDELPVTRERLFQLVDQAKPDQS